MNPSKKWMREAICASFEMFEEMRIVPNKDDIIRFIHDSHETDTEKEIDYETARRWYRDHFLK